MKRVRLLALGILASISYGFGQGAATATSITDLALLKMRGLDEMMNFADTAVMSYVENGSLAVVDPGVLDSLLGEQTPQWSTTFALDEHLILCFRADAPGYLTVFDHTPSGETQKLFPANGSAAFEADTTYCAGDFDSTTQFYADRASGLGYGVLSLHVSNTPEGSGQGKAHASYHVVAAAEAEVAGSTQGTSGDESTQEDRQEAGPREMGIEVEERGDYNICISGEVQLTYLQQVALTDDALLEVRLGEHDCGTVLLPEVMTFRLGGRQVPLTIELNCQSKSMVAVTISERQEAVFSSTTTCGELFRQKPFELSPEQSSS